MAALLACVIVLMMVSGTIQEQCFDTMCWSHDHSKNISCDQHFYHCQLDASGNPKCVTGSVEFGVKCNTTNKYYHCACQQDNYGQAYCDCMGALIFWSVVGVVSSLFLIVQLWLACYCCKVNRSTSHSTTIQTAAAEQPNYGGTRDGLYIAGGVSVFPTDIDTLLPSEPGDSNFPANAPPPSYNQVTAPAFYNPPVNPHYNQRT